MCAENRLDGGCAAAGGLHGGGREELQGTAASVRSAWRKSSWSAYNGNCVEVASLDSGVIAVRDTKYAGCGPTLMFSPVSWNSFLDTLKNGDLPG